MFYNCRILCTTVQTGLLSILRKEESVQMEKYEKVEIEVVEFETNDVITYTTPDF